MLVYDFEHILLFAARVRHLSLSLDHSFPSSLPVRQKRSSVSERYLNMLPLHTATILLQQKINTINTINLTWIWSKCKVKRKLNDYPVHERMHFLPLCFPSYLKMSLNIDCRFLTFPSSFKEPGAAAVATEDRLLSKQALRDSPQSGLCKLTEFNLKNLILSLTLLPRLYVGR